MRKIYALIFIVLLIGNYKALAEPISFEINKEFIRENRDFLDMFTKEERYIILAFEPQLDIFTTFYNVRHTTILMKEVAFTGSQRDLKDVASLYYESKDKTLDGFLDYIINPTIEKRANFEVNVEAFRAKVWQDYRFIKKSEGYKKDKDEFANFAFQLFLKLKGSSYWKLIMEKMEGEL